MGDCEAKCFGWPRVTNKRCNNAVRLPLFLCRRGPPHPQLHSGGRGLAGEERHLQTQLLHLLHPRPIGALCVLQRLPLAHVGLLLLVSAGDPESQDGRPRAL